MTSSAVAPSPGAAISATTPTLTRISVAADGSVWGVDATHAAWQYALATEPWTGYGSMKSVACASDGIFALDGEGGFNQLAPDGSWQPLAGLESGTLVQISALSASVVWGIDSGGAGHTWDGTKWNPAPALPSGDLFRSVDISLDGTVWALGRSQTAYQSVAAPTNWQALSPPEKLQALAAGAPGWIWAIGVSGACYRWAGPDANPPWPTVPAAALEGLACGDDASVWAFDGSNAYAFDLAGSSWQPLAGPDGGTFVCLSVADASTVWAVTEKDGAFAVFRYTAGLRTWQPGGAPVEVQDVAVVNGGDVWAVGLDYSVHRCQNGTWGADPVEGALKTIDAAGDGTVCGTADDGTAWRYVGGPTVWDRLVCQVKLSRVAVGSSSTIVGIDGSGVLYEYDGTPVWPRSSYVGTSGSLADVAVGEEGLIWGIDSASHDVCADLGEDTPWLDTGISAIAVGCATAEDVWAVTADGLPIQVVSPTMGEGLSSGPVSGVAPRWDTEDPFDETRSTHLWIVNRAARLAGPTVAALVLPFQGRISGPGADFHNQLCQGLYDADFVPPFNDKAIRSWWFSHFYDPDTGLNYNGDEEPTALSRGVACATAAIDFAAAGDMATAGYQLGLALHYLTDLTQPMHAGNFTWFSSHPILGYHSDFETYAIAAQASVASPKTYQPSVLPDLASYYRQTAANSKRSWLASVCPPAAEHDYMGWGSAWVASVKPLVPQILQAAIQATAQFLTAWNQAKDAATSTQVVTLVSASSGQVADIRHNQWSPPFTFVQQWQWDGGPNQSWTAVALDGADAGWYRIASPLHPVLGVGGDGKTVIAGEWEVTDDTLRWKLVVGPDGSVAIQNKGTQLWLTCGAPTAKGSTLTVAGQTGDATQQWFMAPVGAVMLKRIGTSQVIDVKGNSQKGGAIVDQFPQKPWGDAQNQEWLRVPLVGVGEESYALLNRNSGLALDVSGTQLVQQAWLPGASSQAWGFIPVGSTASYHVVNRSAPDHVISAAGMDPDEDGLLLQIEPLLEGADVQQWQIVDVPLGS